ncbi:leucine--tRNA ligase [Parcubacteria bacterium DG_72]|nr:MAG: leucine--tRNA ligase [Parcubacteria bacterium DG_72]
MEDYNPEKIEEKWQKIWEEKKLFKAQNPPAGGKPKYYVLVEFPYPSGEGLHVGHCRSYVGLDVVARKRRMQGFNVLFPMGWDAFGLPTENYAIKTGIHPAIATKKNTENFKIQEKKIGLSFDWSREINTTDPLYYKWTQWIFIQLLKKGLAYKTKMPVNWCTSCKIGLANEEVVDEKCERCGGKVVQKEKEQWMLKITEYAQRLIDGLDKVDFPERVKISQREWIGRSQGTEIIFKVHETDFKIPVFTTRPDTLFGCTYVVLAPEHSLIEKLKNKILNYKQIERYIALAKKKVEKERLAEEKEKTGIELKGVKATNPANNRKIPIFVADYVLPQYGTGAIMAVPAHDQRDFLFSQKYNLPIIEVIHPIGTRRKPQIRFSGTGLKSSFKGEGILVNSGRFSGMKSEDAKTRIIEWLETRGFGKKKINYKLRDWIFSRQRYWGEPIPMVYCKKCSWQPVAEKDLPVELPKVKSYKPTEQGESPLAKISSWVKTTCPECGGVGLRETDVMPNWAGSNWYYLRYTDPSNSKKLADSKKLEYFMPIDWYNGGMEHTTLHLLYSRFIYKFLWDIKAVPKSIGPEPYKKRTSHGIILGQGGIKMSKSKGNVINPDQVIKDFGADTLRVYEMFIGPFEQMIPWDTKGVKGVRRFLEKVWGLQEKTVNSEQRTVNKELDGLIHKTIKKVDEDIENLKFNTAVSALMILVNRLEKQKRISLIYYSQFLILLSPFAPHIVEELWQRAGFEGLCSEQKWPKFEKKFIKENKVNLIIQINGKVRDRVEVNVGISEKEAKLVALKSEKVKKWLIKKEIKKIVFVPGKLINFVVDKK